MQRCRVQVPSYDSSNQITGVIAGLKSPPQPSLRFGAIAGQTFLPQSLICCSSAVFDDRLFGSFLLLLLLMLLLFIFVALTPFLILLTEGSIMATTPNNCAVVKISTTTR